LSNQRKVQKLLNYSSNIDDMDEKEKNRKFFFINKARRARGDF
jgi:hypothetical protein